MAVRWLTSEFGSKLRDSLSSTSLVFYLACASLFIVGAAELPGTIFGYPPSTAFGLWALVLVVTVSHDVANRMESESRKLRLSNYGFVPVHWPSIVGALGVGVLGFVFHWLGRPEETLLLALSLGTVGGLVLFFTVGRLWRASWYDAWVRENAHSHCVTHFIVEGQNVTDGSWTWVGCTTDVVGLQPLLLRAHERFEEVRYWRSEAYVTLMQSEAARNLWLASPVEASKVTKTEAAAKIRPC